jgi:hypothetical protein
MEYDLTINNMKNGVFWDVLGYDPYGDSKLCVPRGPNYCVPFLRDYIQPYKQSADPTQH